VTRGDPTPPVVANLKIDVSAGRVCGANRCQAASASPAAPHGQLMKNQAAAFARWAWRVREVTIPKFPPPPPRQAQ
jgi:hypothetical protein